MMNNRMRDKMEIREMTAEDFEAFWPAFKTILTAQETYAFDPGMAKEEAYALWCGSTLSSYAAVKQGEVLGTYYIKPNASGPGSHICNCGYMVSPQARGNGIGRRLCLHSQEIGKKLGFAGMQFNSVVSTNTSAIELWKKLGYRILGTVPGAYRHGKLGFVDTYIMFKEL
jgi:ribosomal protein S18 acetylase RimI-like enzyme